VRHLLEPLATIPGVRTTVLMTPDGVPICVLGAKGSKDPETAEVHALAGLTTGWIGEVTRAVAPLSWAAPQRYVLQAARGTLVILEAPGALLLVVLEGGLQPEDLRLPMDVAVQRLQRHVRGVNADGGAPGEAPEPNGVRPRRSHSVHPAGMPNVPVSELHGTRSGGPEVPQVIGD
jgi:predicted regulator of Ras-like GTPase activity (Roadblock/LC7/MglB family)